MRASIIGPSKQQRSLPFDAQRTVNMYPVIDDSGKEPAALYGTPGLNLFSTCGVGPVRGLFPSTNGRAFAVSLDTLYEISSAGVATSRGTLSTASGAVYMDENPTQLMITDGTSGYIFTYASNAFAAISDPDFPACQTMTFIDGYFIVNKTDTGSFYISAINNGTSWGSLDFATAESSPDYLRRVINAVGLLWLLGDNTTEIWSNTGAVSFPFERVSGGKMEIGILAPASAVAADNTLIWLGRDSYGSGIVYRAQGFTPQRISDDAVEYAISQATDKSNIRSWTYQEGGHTFYALTGGGLATTWVFDLTTQIWHERAFLNSDGFYELHLAVDSMYIFGKNLVGDRRNGSVYEMKLDYYSDNGSPLCRERTMTHLSDENRRLRYNCLEIAMETGVGSQTGQGYDPTILLSLSKDMGRTYSCTYSKPIGMAGKYNQVVKFYRLGISETMTFRVRITDPVKVSMIGAYVNVL